MEPNVLKPDTTYYWRVTALTKDLKHETASSTGIRSFKTEAVPCSPLLYAEYAEGSTVNLLFQESIDATSSNEIISQAILARMATQNYQVKQLAKDLGTTREATGRRLNQHTIWDSNELDIVGKALGDRKSVV